MKVVIREAAEDDLDRIFAWIAKDNPRAAADMVARIRERIDRLELDQLAHTGRPGFVEGTRELIEYPYSCTRSSTSAAKFSCSRSSMARKIAS